MSEELNGILAKIRTHEPNLGDLIDRLVAELDKRYASMWHQHRNVHPYVFEGSASWTSCPRCAMKYPETEFHSCPDIKFDLLGRPKK